jgi:hypothetical protein
VGTHVTNFRFLTLFKHSAFVILSKPEGRSACPQRVDAIYTLQAGRIQLPEMIRLEELREESGLMT